MNNIMKDLLLVQSFDLGNLIEEYRLFFISILPSIFLFAVLFEYFDRLDPFSLVKRALISVVILTSVTSFYHKAISASMDTANEILKEQKQSNILLMDMFDGIQQWDKLHSDKKGHEFYKDKNVIWGTLAFLKYHLFDSFVNDGFTITIFFITKLCFLILKVVYSLVYYLGYGLIGIPCLLYLFPTMGNVLRGAILSFLWCLVVPHVLVFIISMIGSEINKGYVSGNIIGGSMIGTTLLFILTLFIAFTPLITAMILNGSGVSQAGGIIATIGANYVMNLPKNTLNNSALVLSGGSLGPKTKLATGAIGGTYKLAKGAKNIFSNKSDKEWEPQSHPHRSSASYKSNNTSATSSYKGSSGSVNTNSNIKSSSIQGHTSKTNNWESKSSMSSNTVKGGNNNGTISKSGTIHRGTQKANNNHSSSRRISTSTHTRYRNGHGKPERRP